jgi:tetratricopeptide (TPR) repeat protein
MAAVTSSRIGEIHYDGRDFAAAAAAFQRASDLDKDPSMKAMDLGNLGHVQYHLGRLDEAASSYQQCLALRAESGFLEGIDSDLTNYYHVCHYLGRPKEACEAYGRLMTPRGAPYVLQFDSYLLRLDEMGEELPVVRAV